MLARAVAGALNLEDLSAARDLWIAYGVMFALGADRVAPPRCSRAGAWPARRRGTGVRVVRDRSVPIAAGDGLERVAGVDPTLGLGLAATALLGLVSPWLAGRVRGAAAHRTAARAERACDRGRVPPTTDSHLSFPRLTRLQRVVESSRRELKAKEPRLPHQAQVRYWWVPRLTEFGFQGPYAVRVWYGDSTLVWEKFGGNEGYDRHSDALVEYLNDTAWPAQVDEVELLDYIRRGRDLMDQNRWLEADTVFAQVIALHHSDQGGLLASIVQNRARIAFNHPQLRALRFTQPGLHPARPRRPRSLGTARATGVGRERRRRAPGRRWAPASASSRPMQEGLKIMRMIETGWP
jgi:hypothetical protein